MAVRWQRQVSFDELIGISERCRGVATVEIRIGWEPHSGRKRFRFARPVPAERHLSRTRPRSKEDEERAATRDKEREEKYASRREAKGAVVPRCYLDSVLLFVNHRVQLPP